MLGLSCGRQDLPSLLQQAGSFAARQIFSCGMRALGLLSSSADKETACNAEDPGLIPGFRRSPGEGNGNPLQFSCLENPMDRGSWWVTVHWVAKQLDTTEWLNNKNWLLTRKRQDVVELTPSKPWPRSGTRASAPFCPISLPCCPGYPKPDFLYGLCTMR